MPHIDDEDRKFIGQALDELTVLAKDELDDNFRYETMSISALEIVLKALHWKAGNIVTPAEDDVAASTANRILQKMRGGPPPWEEDT